MWSSISRLADTHVEGLYKKCKDFKSDLQYGVVKDILLTFKCVDSNKNFEKQFDEDSAKRFESLYRFCYGDINKLLQKGVHPYETWEIARDSMKCQCQTIKSVIAISQ